MLSINVENATNPLYPVEGVNAVSCTINLTLDASGHLGRDLSLYRDIWRHLSVNTIVTYSILLKFIYSAADLYMLNIEKKREYSFNNITS